MVQRRLRSSGRKQRVESDERRKRMIARGVKLQGRSVRKSAAGILECTGCDLAIDYGRLLYWRKPATSASIWRRGMRRALVGRVMVRPEFGSWMVMV